MCMNDVYVCKDLTRINCTLACSTLGYIPCKNYVDKLVCSSIAKKALIKPNFIHNPENGNINNNSIDKFLSNNQNIIILSKLSLYLISFASKRAIV